MNCKKINTSAYLDNALGEHDKKIVEQHLNACKSCAKEYAALKNTKQILSALNKQKAGANFENKVMSKIKRGAFAANPLESFFATAKTSLIVAVLLFGIIAAFSFFTPSTASNSNINNIDAINNYVLKGNAFTKQSKISYAKMMQAMLG